MADLNKFEKMLELLVNEDKAAAQELFHEIVVEKSRDIYESLLEDEDDLDEAEDEEDEEVDEASDEEVDESDEDLDEGFDMDTFEVEADDEEADDMDDEEGDDMDMDDEEGDDMDMDDEEGEEGDVEDRVEDLEDALDDLKAEFEKMMSGDDGDDEEGDDMDMGGDATDDMMGDLGMDDDEEPTEDMGSDSFQATITPMEARAAMSAGEQMREYVEKVNGGELGSKIGGDNGVNTKSATAKPNNMGGTTANLRGGESKSAGTQGGLAAPTPKDMNTKNVNVVGAKGATKMSSQPGHGAEKKGKPETADKSASSMLNGAPKRAK
jgi:hypothetical protein